MTQDTPTIKAKRLPWISGAKSVLTHSWILQKTAWKTAPLLMFCTAFVLLSLALFPFLTNGVRALLVNRLSEIGLSLGNPMVLWPVLGAIALLVLTPSFQAWYHHLTKTLWRTLEAHYELAILKKKGDLDLAFHEDPQKKDLLSRVNEHGIWRLNNLTERQFFIIQNAIEMLMAGGVLLLADWRLCLLVAIGAIPELLVELKYGAEFWSISGAKAEVKRRYWEYTGYFQQTFSLIELKLFQAGPHFIDRIMKLFKEFQGAQAVNDRRHLLWHLCAILFMQSTLVLSFLFFAKQTVDGVILIGTFLFFITAMADFRQSLSSCFNNIAKQYQDNLFVGDVFAFLALPIALAKPRIRHRISPRKTPTIVFDRVSFTYPRSNTPTLSNCSFTLQPGTSTAIVGANGAGKTTLIKLLCRFYDPTQGRILVDGHDLKTIDLDQWYSLLGALFQEYIHYNIPVDEAIAVGRTAITKQIARIKKSAEQSQSDRFINHFPNGYKQMLGTAFTDGVEPSIGQWQKLALARTFYRNPRILILDEPTSAIDAEAEQHIFDHLTSLAANRITLLISHRFSTVRHANRILVIEHGTISEQGTHEELMHEQGTYARLFTLQATSYR